MHYSQAFEINSPLLLKRPSQFEIPATCTALGLLHHALRKSRFLLLTGRPPKHMTKRPAPEGRSSESSDEMKIPKSPSFDSLLISRLEEKEELQHLNDRFANIIEYLHKDIFSKEFSSHIDLLKNSLKNELEDYVKVFSNEVELLRQNLNKTSLELTNAKIQLKKTTSDLEETIKQLDRSKASETDMANKITSLTAQLSQLQSQLDACLNYKTDYDSLMNQHKMLKSQLEKETLLHTDTKNQLLTALEQLEFKNQLLEKEHNIWNNESIQTYLTTIIKGVEVNTHDKLCGLLSEIRSQMAIQYDHAKNKIKEGLEATLNAEKLRSNSLEQDLQNKTKECQRLSQLVLSQTNDLSNCRTELDITRKQLRNLESQLKVSEDKLHGIASQHRSEIERLLGLLADKSTECAELAGIKVQLDAELAMYRKLLECEESRAYPIADAFHSVTYLVDRLADVEKSADTSDNLISRYPLTTKCATSHPPPYTHAASFDKQGTLDSTETSHTTSKTGIIDLDLCRSGLSTSSSSSLIGNSLRITCRADGPIHFASADPGNGLIRIYNASQRVINLSNWHLYVGPTHEGSLDYVKLYTFPKSQILQPHAELQVFLCWASEASQVSSPKRRRRDITAVLHLITPVSVWNPHSSVIALQDSTGAVRATCEMESCCKKIKKMPKSLVVGGTDEENGSSDKVSSVDSDEELHSFDDPQQPTIGEDDNNKNEISY
ncbi:Lamin-L(II) [Schistosoma japonicum]|nr:Lamin-L(II) [Schistosoma japonicum]KAH8870327.1 Lamin-L(II) [Schistosoma japonicum]